MINNLFILAFAFITLLFIWLVWLRHQLAFALQNVQQRQEILKGDLAKRRDMIPYLLESFLKTESKSDMWNRLLHERSEFHKEQSLEKEWEFEKSIFKFLDASSKVKSVSFLEAKKDIEDVSSLIEKEKQNFKQSIDAYNKLRKMFPYSMVSGIFGFQELIS